MNHMTKQRLPHRALICPYKQIIHYETEYLRTVANRYGINSNRREFYRMCQALALQYYVDLMNEYDFYALGHVKTVYRRALAIGRRFAVSLDPINTRSTAYSWYREMNFQNDDEIDTRGLREWVIDFNASMERDMKKLPETPTGRRARLALRRWANAHMDFWMKEISGRITIPNDRRDDMSRCHRFLDDPLKPIDPDALDQLPTIIRERRTAERQRTGRASG